MKAKLNLNGACARGSILCFGSLIAVSRGGAAFQGQCPTRVATVTPGAGTKSARAVSQATAAMSKQRIEPGPGQESVWDYPRPPRCEPTDAHIQVFLGGELIADTRGAYRVLETSHPPVYYIPPQDVKLEKLTKASGQNSYCEWKGTASYYNAPGVPSIAWYYPSPVPQFSKIKDYLAFYPSKVDKATVDGEEVKPQPGDFYGGWITSKVVGPFKGSTGTWGW